VEDKDATFVRGDVRVKQQMNWYLNIIFNGVSDIAGYPV